VERRLARLDRWVRPSGVESVPPPPATDPSGMNTGGINGAGAGSGGINVTGINAAAINAVGNLRFGVTEEVSPPSQRVPSMSGSLGDMSVGTLLSMFELEKRTGWLTIHGDRDNVRFELLDGAVANG